MKEDSGQILEAMDHLDPALIEDMDGQTAAKRRRIPARTLLIAACVAGVLILGAVGSEVMGLQVSPILSGNELGWLEPSEDPEVYSGYTVQGVDGFSWDNVSEELKAEAEKAQDGSYIAYFSSQAELEATLGFTLPGNSVLDAAREGKGHYQLAESEDVIHTFGRLWIVLEGDGNVHSLHVWTNYAVSNPEHKDHKINLPISEEMRKSGTVAIYHTCTGEVLVGVEYQGQEGGTSTINSYKNIKLTQEDYVTPSGVKTVIIHENFRTSDDFDDGYRSYLAHLAVDGMTLTIHVNGNENCTDVKGVLKSILDAYPAS